MRCPRCQAAITTSPDAAGALRCPSCGAKLLTLAAAAARPPAPEAEPTPPPVVAPPKAAPKPVPSDLILAELRVLRAGQEEILALLRSDSEQHRDEREDVPDAGPTQTVEDDLGFVPPLRTKGRKSVVLIDDDRETRVAASSALEQADVPVRAYADGRVALQAMAEEKPDLIVIELDLRGEMAGKDVINVIKAAMEWVDIPIILYTRQSVENQREARTVHGADEFVLKSAGPAILVARCIALFRRS